MATGKRQVGLSGVGRRIGNDEGESAVLTAQRNGHTRSPVRFLQESRTIGFLAPCSRPQAAGPISHIRGGAEKADGQRDDQRLKLMSASEESGLRTAARQQRP